MFYFWVWDITISKVLYYACDYKRAFKLVGLLLFVCMYIIIAPTDTVSFYVIVRLSVLATSVAWMMWEVDDASLLGLLPPILCV